MNPTTGVPYPNNIIPQSQLSPNGIGLLNAYPRPTRSTIQTTGLTLRSIPRSSEKTASSSTSFRPIQHHFRFSLLNYNYNDYEPHFGNFNTNPRIFNRPNQIGVFRYTWTISPTMVNDAFVSGAADHVDINIDTSSGLYDRTKYGINYPYLFGSASKVIPNKIPTIQLSNFGTLDGGPYPSRSGGIVYDVGDTVTKVWGPHTFKFGGLWEYAGENNYDQISVDNTRPGTTNNQNGLFVFTDARGGSSASPVPTSKAAIANVALGLFDTYGEIGTRSYTLFRGNMFEGFGQDQWRVSPKLVLEYGLRYSIMMPYHALWGNQAFFSEKDYNPALAPTVNPTTGFITGGDPLNGVVIPGSGFPSSAQGHVPDAILNGGYQRLFRGYGSGYSPTVYSDIQPRFGFAYSGNTRHSHSRRSWTLHAAPRHQRHGARRRQCSFPAGLERYPWQRGQPRRYRHQRHSAGLHLACLHVSQPRSVGMERDGGAGVQQGRCLHAELRRPSRLPSGATGKRQPASAGNHTGESTVSIRMHFVLTEATPPLSKLRTLGGLLPLLAGQPEAPPHARAFSSAWPTPGPRASTTARRTAPTSSMLITTASCMDPATSTPGTCWWGTTCGTFPTAHMHPTHLCARCSATGSSPEPPGADGPSADGLAEQRPCRSRTGIGQPVLGRSKPAKSLPPVCGWQEHQPVV